MPEYRSFKPGPFGPYSTVVISGDKVYIAGQIPVTEEGEVIEGGLYEQAKRALELVVAAAEKAGSSRDRLVALRVYTTQLENASEINRAFYEVLQQPYPARELIGAAKLPLGALVEIAGIAEL